MTFSFLKFSKGNAKLDKNTLIFNLPAGRTCPGAKNCLAFVVNENGKRIIKRSKDTEFSCFAADSEQRFPNVFNQRKYNLDLLNKSFKENGFNGMVNLITNSLTYYQVKHNNSTNVLTKVRIHESGDYYSMDYLKAWLEVCKNKPSLKFYSYSKSLNFFDGLALPSNFYLTKSYGGRYDHLIKDNERSAKVVFSESEAINQGLAIDKDESNCFKDDPFALLIHGRQQAGTHASKSVWALKNKKRRQAY